MSLADDLERKLAEIHRHHPRATRRFVAEQMAKVAGDHATTNVTTLPKLLCIHPMSESELIITEARRMRQQISNLRAELAEMKAEGAL